MRQSHGFADYASYPLTMLRCPQKLSCRRGWGSMEHAGFAPVNKSSNSDTRSLAYDLGDIWSAEHNRNE